MRYNLGKSNLPLISMTKVLAAAASALMLTAATPEERLPGPIDAQVIRVIDGDTIAVRARIWLRQEVETNVRVANLDTPEKNGSCEAERVLARQAQDFVEAKLADGWVRLRDIAFEKYGGRVVATVETAQGGNLADLVRAAKLGRAYDGGHKAAWCPDEVSERR